MHANAVEPDHFPPFPYLFAKKKTFKEIVRRYGLRPPTESQIDDHVEM